MTSLLREYSDLVVQVGDIIHWNDIYWEIDSVVQNKLIFGKDPDKIWEFNNNNSYIVKTSVSDLILVMVFV